MATEVYAKECIDWWRKQNGTQGTSKSSPYSKDLDSCGWYNTKKNGYASWCCCYYDDAIHQNASGDNINEQRTIACEPNPASANSGAGCVQKVQMYKDAGRWYTKASLAESGDQVFFRSDSYVSKSNPLGVYHTGAVLTWDDKGYYVSEGNTNGNKVAEKFYPYSAVGSKIAGFGRPRWTGWERPKAEEPAEPTTPAPEPTPEPSPAPVEPSKKSIDEIAKEVIAGKWGNGKERADRLTEAGYNYSEVQAKVNEMLGIGNSGNSGKSYTVCVNTKLNVRAGAGTGYKIVRQLSNGDKVTVYETKSGWGRIGDGEWVSMNYIK